MSRYNAPPPPLRKQRGLKIALGPDALCPFAEAMSIIRPRLAMGIDAPSAPQIRFLAVLLSKRTRTAAHAAITLDIIDRHRIRQLIDTLKPAPESERV